MQSEMDDLLRKSERLAILSRDLQQRSRNSTLRLLILLEKSAELCDWHLSEDDRVGALLRSAASSPALRSND